MTYPYSVKNYKSFQTSDGLAISGNLYCGKAKIGTVEDQGHGGGSNAHFDTRAANDAFIAWVGTLGEHTITLGSISHTAPHDFESALDLLISEAEAEKERKQLDRAAATKLIFRTAEDGEDQYRTIKLPAALLSRPTTELIAVHPDWFTNIVQVWIIGQGWTKLSAA